MRTYKELIVSSAIASLVALSSTAAAIELTEVGSGKIENINIPKDQNTEETVQNTPTTQNSTVDAAGASESAAVQKSVKTEDNSQTTQPVRTSGGKKTAYISDDAKVWATRGPGKQYKLSGQIRIGERVEFLSERNDYGKETDLIYRHAIYHLQHQYHVGPFITGYGGIFCTIRK